MTEENSNYVWGCVTTLVIFIIIGSGITMYISSNRENVQPTKDVVRKPTQQPDNTLATWAMKTDFFNSFYSSHCFSVKSLDCPWNGPSTMVIPFTNHTRYPIDAVRFGLTVTDKLQNEVYRGDLQFIEKVPSKGSINVRFEFSQGEAVYALCKYRIDQLHFSFSLPFTNTSGNPNDIVITFADGMLIRNFMEYPIDENQISHLQLY